jgi:DNA (cytosine-5)-methyltransferase 1
MGNNLVQTTLITTKRNLKKVAADDFVNVLTALGKPQPSGKLKGFGFFSGGGGLDLGMSYAGFDIVYTSDIETQHCETLKHNFPEAIVEAADITKQSGAKIFKDTGLESVDIMVGGPPCQSFSILGKRKSFEDERGKLVFEYARMVREIKPKAFVLENVPGLLNVNKGKDWEELLKFFKEETGYTLYHKVLNSANYGAPQIRRRVFLVGFRENKKFEFPKPTHHSIEMNTDESVPNWVTSRQALVGVDGLPNQLIRIHGDRVRGRYEQIPQGGRDKIDRTDRLHPEMPSGTVIVGSSKGGGRPFIHFQEPRHLTVREAARLQSFPDWYEFKNTSTWQYRAVGNAVPVLMAKAVGERIRIALES